MAEAACDRVVATGAVAARGGNGGNGGNRSRVREIAAKVVAFGAEATQATQGTRFGCKSSLRGKSRVARISATATGSLIQVVRAVQAVRAFGADDGGRQDDGEVSVGIRDNGGSGERGVSKLSVRHGCVLGEQSRLGVHVKTYWHLQSVRISFFLRD